MREVIIFVLNLFIVGCMLIAWPAVWCFRKLKGDEYEFVLRYPWDQ